MKNRPTPSRKPKVPARVNPLLARLMQPAAGAGAAATPPPASPPKASPPNWQAILGQAAARFYANELQAAAALLAPLMAHGFIACEVNNLAAVLAASNQEFERAQTLWQQNLQYNPRDADSWSNLGRMLEQSGKLQAAAEHLQHAIALQPQHANGHLNLGVVYTKLHRHDEALACYRQVLTLEPDNAKAWFNTGKTLHNRQDFAGASAAYERAIALDARQWDAQSNLLFTQHYLDHFDAAANRDLAVSLGRKKAAGAPPPAWNAQARNAQALHAQALHAQALHPDKPVLRVGLVSADLRTHPVGFFLESMLAALSGSDIALYAYANTHTFDALSNRIRPAFVQWENVSVWSDAALSQRIAADGIDILIDLAGHSAGNRLTVFASRAAPVQMSWLGYFSTTGVPHMDFVLADPHCVPVAEEVFFSERVLRLPHTRYCFSPLQHADLPTQMPLETSNGVRFACYHVLAKINGRVLACWREILAADAQASLVIYSRDLERAQTLQDLRERLSTAGLDNTRIDLRPGLPYAQYLQSYADIDVLLDTFPYPGGTTTAEALWMGVPTLTLAQPGMLGRQGQGILSAAGMAPWVTHTEAQYIAAGQALARRDSALLESARTLRARPQAVRASTLFDTTQFVHDWRNALRTAWTLRCAEIHATLAGASP